MQEAPAPSMSNVINYSKPSATVFKRGIKGLLWLKPTARQSSWVGGQGDRSRGALPEVGRAFPHDTRKYNLPLRQWGR